MDAVVAAAFVAGIGGIVTGLLTLRATRATESTKQKQLDNQTELDTVKLRLETWADLVNTLRSELTIERTRNKQLQDVINELESKNG